MRHGYTHITLVCDRSGSMSAVRSDAEGAVNQFIKEQKDVPGEATLHLIDFDAPGGMKEDWYRIVHQGDIKSCPFYTLNPRGSTALHDAVGRAITETGEFLAGMSEDQRPEHVIFVVQTDGQENSSRDWKLERIREAIKTQTDQFNWQFLFLGMGPDTFAQGHDMGFQNVTHSAQTGDSYVGTYSLASSNVSAVRGGTAKDLSGANAEVDEHGNVKQS